MRLPFGLTLSRFKALSPTSSLSSVDSRGGWWPWVKESFAGAWQHNVEVRVQDVITNPTVWACATLIARDFSRLWIKLVEKDDDGIATEIENPAFSPVLRKQNHYQTRVKFFESWMLSKLLHGNTYVLKERNNRGGLDNGNVIALYILDPSRVQVLVAPDGSVFYALNQDYLSGLQETSVVVPASEIIHDIMVPLYHPLVGVSPIHAAGYAALHGLTIQRNSSKLFQSGTMLSGVLSSPVDITPEIASRLQQNWDQNYQGEANAGRVAIVGNGFKFYPLTQSAVDAQLIDQFKFSGELICSVYHVPGYKVGIGAPPPYTDIQSINLEYYNTAIAPDLENLEVLLTEGLELSSRLSVEFDLMALLRMDTKTQTEVLTGQVGAGFLMPNEARAEFDRKPVTGGDACYLQQQNFSLDALNKRDQAGPPSNMPGDGRPSSRPAGPDDDEDMSDDIAAFSAALLTELADVNWVEIADAA